MSRRGWAMFAAMSVIWGMPYLLIKVAVGGVPVSVLVLARVVLGAALLLPIAVRRGQLGAIRGSVRWLALFAVVEIIVPWFLLAEAERKITSSLTGLLIAATPIIVALLSLLIRTGDRLSGIRWAGLLVGLAGVALLAGPNLVGSGASGGAAVAVAEVLVVAVCYAAGPIIANNKLTGIPPIGMTAVCLVFASVVYAPLAALNWPSVVPSAKVLLAIAGLAVVCTALAFGIFFNLIAEVGPARATVITYINPAIAVSLGVSVLGERVTPVMLAAFGTILVGSVLATRPARRPGGDDQGQVHVPAVDPAAAISISPAPLCSTLPPHPAPRPTPLESSG